MLFQGIIPLGNCTIEEINLHGVSYALCIQLPDQKVTYVF